MIKKMLTAITVSVLLASLTGCASSNIGTPCPNFGSSCSKTPINSWNDTL